MAAPSDIYRAAPEVVTRRIVGETLLVPVSGHLATLDQMFALNETGDLVWSQLDGSRSLGSVCEALCAAFEVSSEEAWSDLEELVGALAEAGLVQAVETTTGAPG